MRWNPKAEKQLQYQAEREGPLFKWEVRDAAEDLVVRLYSRQVVQSYHVRMAARKVELRRKMRRAVAEWNQRWRRLSKESKADLIRRLEALV